MVQEQRRIKFTHVAAGVLLLALALAPFAFIRREPAGPTHNVVIISVDTLRADHLGCYGYEQAVTPAIDGLAADGALFEQAFAQRSLTWPSLASIMTATYPYKHGVRNQGTMLSDTQPTLATKLKEKGYATACFLANTFEQNWQGFDSVEGFDVGDKPAGAFMTDAAMEWMTSNKDEAFFLWVHYIAPHASYDPPEYIRKTMQSDYNGPYDGDIKTLERIALEHEQLTAADVEHIVSLYDGEVQYMDEQVKTILDTLDGLELADDTLVVFTSDHGEDLYERNFYFGHSPSVYDSCLQIPLIFRLPNAVPEGHREETIVESIDIAPTVLSLLGYHAPGSFQGDSLEPLLRGKDLDLGPAISELEDVILTVRTDEYKYVSNPFGARPEFIANNPRAHYFIDVEELYWLESDPKELDNVTQTYPRRLDQLRAMAKDWMEKHHWEFLEYTPAPPIENEQLKERLRALGYLE